MNMKKAFSIFILSVLAIASAHARETKGVVVTIKPLHSLVSGVIGDTGEATLLLSGTTSPHDFQLKPSQMRGIQKATVVFYIDDSFETFLAGAFEALPDAMRRVAMVQKAGLSLLSYRKGGAWEAHQHEVHENDAEGQHHAHEAGHYDLHVWLDPKNAIRMVKSITKELSAIYPENRNVYKANARQMVKSIKALNEALKAELASVKDRPFIVFHDAYQYFERAYGLRGVGSILLNPEASPSPNRIRAVRGKLKETGAQCVFREPQFSDRLVDTVREATNAKSGILDPLGADLAPGADLYVKLLRNLAHNLKEGLD